MAYLPLYILWGDAEVDYVACFCSQCCLWASSWAQCSSTLQQQHHVPHQLLAFRNSSCEETTLLAQLCLLIGGSLRKPQLPKQVREHSAWSLGRVRADVCGGSQVKQTHIACISPLTFDPRETPGTAPAAWCWLRQTPSTLEKWDRFNFIWENVTWNQMRDP